MCGFFSKTASVDYIEHTIFVQIFGILIETKRRIFQISPSKKTAKYTFARKTSPRRCSGVRVALVNGDIVLAGVDVGHLFFNAQQAVNAGAAVRAKLFQSEHHVVVGFYKLAKTGDWSSPRGPPRGDRRWRGA